MRIDSGERHPQNDIFGLQLTLIGASAPLEIEAVYPVDIIDVTGNKKSLLQHWIMIQQRTRAQCIFFWRGREKVDTDTAKKKISEKKRI